MPGIKYPPEMETFCRVKGMTRTLPEIAEAIRQRYGYQMSEVALKCYLNRRGIQYQKRQRHHRWPDSIAFSSSTIPTGPHGPMRKPGSR